MTPEPWSASDHSSFAHESVTKRWPAILDGVIKDLQQVESADAGVIAQQVQRLKEDIVAFKELDPIPEDGHPNTSIYNQKLRQLQAENMSTWLSSPWLAGECHLYALLRSFFASTSLDQYDPFRNQKQSTFKSSNVAVIELVELLDSVVASDADEKQKQFYEFLFSCLWGNATDLSLLTNLTEEDIVRLQSGNASEKMGQILASDLEAVYKHISSLHQGRLDFVLDNSGFELFTDLVLADWLVTKTPFFREVVFHPKCIPWFVSDVLVQQDLEDLFEHLGRLAETAPQQQKVNETVQRWRSHFEAGRFKWTTPKGAPIGANVPLANFWTSPFDFRSIRTDDPLLFSELSKSDLVLFKGDLNYRKLTGDLRWPPETPFTEALGDLNGRLNVLTLRTAKADVIVGLRPGQAEQLDQKDPRWRVNGKYAVVSFAPADKSLASGIAP